MVLLVVLFAWHVATKATFRSEPGPNGLSSSRYHLLRACEARLRHLVTGYIDMYYLHGFDALIPVEETVRTLDDRVRSGKVRALAWLTDLLAEAHQRRCRPGRGTPGHPMQAWLVRYRGDPPLAGYGCLAATSSGMWRARNPLEATSPARMGVDETTIGLRCACFGHSSRERAAGRACDAAGWRATHSAQQVPAVGAHP